MIEQTGQSPSWEPGSGEFGSTEPGFAEFDFDGSTAPENFDRRLSFETLLGNICERLQDTKQQGSLKRIRQLEAVLDQIEKDLAEWLPEPPRSEQT